jgi:3',5'-cyclic AMP phosphodiesterase CpdA
MRETDRTRRHVLRVGAGAVLLAGCGLGPGHALRPRSRRPLRLVFYTDVHARADGDTPRALALAARAINAARPDLIVAGGDLVTGGFNASAAAMAPHWDAYMAMHDALTGDRHVVIGNHDLVAAAPQDGSPPAADPRSVFRSRFRLARTFYAFDAGGHHFIVLDAIDVVGGDLGYRGWVGTEQLAWLDADLARVGPDTPIVLATHMPLVTAFFGATEGATAAAPANRVVVNSRAVLDRFARHRLVLVLQGHLHVREEVRWRGTTFLTGGAIAGGWWRGPFHGTPEGFNVVTLDDGRVDCRYVGYGWTAARPARAAADGAPEPVDQCTAPACCFTTFATMPTS